MVIGLLGTNSAYANDLVANDPLTVMEKMKPSTGAKGIVFLENASPAQSIGWIRYSHIPTFEPDGSIKPENYWDWTKCDKWSDSNCPIKNGYMLDGKVFLGQCIDAVELGCVESFKVAGSIGSEKKLTYVGKSFAQAIDTPQDLGLGIPRSSSPPVYKDDDGNLFVIRAVLTVTLSGPTNSQMKIDVDVTPVIRIIDSTLAAPRAIQFKDFRTGLGVVSAIVGSQKCISVDEGICYRAITPSTENNYSVSVRVPRAVSGWLRGRVADANFDVQLKNENSQLITLTGNPVTMPIAGGWVRNSELPIRFVESVWPSGNYDPNPNASLLFLGDASQGDQALREYSAWVPFLKDNAVSTVKIWSFGTNMASSDQSCLKVTGEISGFVASNASLYSSRPPIWDAGSSTLTYKVAAPHFDENGKVNSGTYTLAMPLKSIKCLYGQNNLPPSATVSIVYGTEVKTVSTISLKSENGWIYFSASGFHYSDPTIVVKFAASVDVLVPTPSPTPLPSVTAKAKPAAMKSTIWCAKGTAKRKVTAAKPACPKGFKKIAAPIAR
jgi:hypothetical protein